MKYLLTALTLASSVNAFSPSTSFTKCSSTAMNAGWDSVGGQFDDDQWYYKPWGGITEDTFYPQSHAGNRMFFFPLPSETVGAFSNEGPSSTAPSLPEGADAAPMPEMDAAKVSANV